MVGKATLNSYYAIYCDHGHLKELVSERLRWRQDSKCERMKKPAENSRRLKRDSDRQKIHFGKQIHIQNI